MSHFDELKEFVSEGRGVRPRRSSEFEKLLRGALGGGVSYGTRGDMAFATSEHRTPA